MLESPEARAKLRRKLETWPDDRKCPMTINQALELLDLIDKSELAQLRAENDKLRGQVEGLKECLCAAMLLFLNPPTIPYESLPVVAKHIAENMDVDKYIPQFWKTFDHKGINEIATSTEIRDSYLLTERKTAPLRKD